MGDRRTLLEIAASMRPQDLGTKPDYVWRDLEPLFAPLARRPLNIIEVGVYNGVSIRTLASCFPEARVIGLDLELPAIDLSDHPLVSLIACDQRDASRLNAICDEHMPGGIDIVIDDASHIGAFSLATYRALFPRVRPGGLYIVEDWGTGYIPQRADGGELVQPCLLEPAFGIARRITSHDYGMVGFVKSLIDDLTGPVRSLQANSAFFALTKQA